MTQSQLTASVASAMTAAGLSQRDLSALTGISQPTLSRILSGNRVAKMPEIIKIADAVGCTLAQLTGSSASTRVQFAARATNDTGMEVLHQRLLHFIELDAYLDDQAIPTR